MLFIINSLSESGTRNGRLMFKTDQCHGTRSKNALSLVGRGDRQVIGCFAENILHCMSLGSVPIRQSEAEGKCGSGIPFSIE